MTTKTLHKHQQGESKLYAKMTYSELCVLMNVNHLYVKLGRYTESQQCMQMLIMKTLTIL